MSQNRLAVLEDHIGRSLQESHDSGELQTAKSWGKPLATSQGYEETPEEFRLPFKILKDAGFVPPEIELIAQLRRLKEEFSSMDANHERFLSTQALIADLQLKISVRMENLRASGRY